MSAQPLLPNEFLWAVTEPQYADDDPRQFAAAVADAQARRHPDVLGLQPDGFAIPMATALFLYRREPKNYRDVVLSALYVPTSTTFWERIAAAARDAWAAQDWSLLGRLAYRFEIGVTRCACTGWDGLTKEPIADHLAKPENARVAVQPVQLALVRTAFLQAFDFQHGVIPAAGYVRAALAYWAELPAHFVLPPGCCLGGDVPTVGDWPLLTTFCGHNVAAWHAVPGAFETATQHTSPLLRLAIERLRQAPLETLPRERRTKNPFKPLVAAIAVEPKKKRPRAEKVKVKVPPPLVKKPAVTEPQTIHPPVAQPQPLASKRGLLKRMLGVGK